VTREDRERIGGTLVLQYRPSDDVTITADALYTKFTNKTETRSYGHWFTASNLTDVVTDANGTATDLTQASGIATDFHYKKFDKRTNTREFGLNLEWKMSPTSPPRWTARIRWRRKTPTAARKPIWRCWAISPARRAISRMDPCCRGRPKPCPPSPTRPAPAAAR
jgi:hypothetical protein